MTTTRTNAIELKEKPHYEILDGLRGVAAMIVVVFHLFETYSAGPARQIVNHGYLAVDFFFLLSGFVIGYAYDDRWGQLTLREFFKRRLIRLHPMVILGSALGALLFYFSSSEAFPSIAETPWWQLVATFLLGCTLLPALPGWDIRGWGETAPLNGPAWTLMWEYVANLLYALLFRHLPKFLLALFVLSAGVLTLDLSLDLDLFGLLAERRSAAYTVIGGWSITAEQCYIGAARLLYPFLCGLLLARLGWKIRLKGGFALCATAVALLLVFPHIGGDEPNLMNGIYNALCILVLFPLIVAAGAGSPLREGRTLALCRFLGNISYPLYITHYPLIYIQIAWALKHPDAPLSTHICVGVSVFLLAIAIAYAALQLYDLPVRAWLTKRFSGGASKK